MKLLQVWYALMLAEHSASLSPEQGVPQDFISSNMTRNQDTDRHPIYGLPVLRRSLSPGM
jgi:hypothetical protein